MIYHWMDALAKKKYFQDPGLQGNNGERGDHRRIHRLGDTAAGAAARVIMAATEKIKLDLLSSVEKAKVKFIELQFTDVEGMVKNLTIPAGELDSSLIKGVWFDGSCIEGYARVAESDMYLMPDPSTYALIPRRRCPNQRTGRRNDRRRGRLCGHPQRQGIRSVPTPDSHTQGQRGHQAKCGVFVQVHGQGRRN